MRPGRRAPPSAAAERVVEADRCAVGIEERRIGQRRPDRQDARWRPGGGKGRLLFEGGIRWSGSRAKGLDSPDWASALSEAIGVR